MKISKVTKKGNNMKISKVTPFLNKMIKNSFSLFDKP